jgi:hypothetical protein
VPQLILIWRVYTFSRLEHAHSRTRGLSLLKVGFDSSVQKTKVTVRVATACRFCLFPFGITPVTFDAVTRHLRYQRRFSEGEFADGAACH